MAGEYGRRKLILIVAGKKGFEEKREMGVGVILRTQANLWAAEN